MTKHDSEEFKRQHDVMEQQMLPALPTEMYELGGEVHRSGRSFPLSTRLLVEALLSVGEDGLIDDKPVALEIPLRTLHERLWPNSRFRDDTDRLRRAVQEASDALDSWEAAWPWHDPRTGRGGSRRVVLVSDIGSGPDGTVRLTVDLPPAPAEGTTATSYARS